MNNAHVRIVKADGQTKLWIAVAPGIFNTFPSMAWARELSDGECAAMLENPYRVFNRPRNESTTGDPAPEKTLA